MRNEAFMPTTITSTMSKSIAYKHYLRALSRYPGDLLRPETQFKDFMRRRIDKRFNATPLENPDATLIGSVNEKAEMEQVNALYSLLEDRYKRKYPITGTLMKPASKPTHYSDLLRELEEAPSRSWWENTKNRWKGFLRFQ